MPVQTRRQFLQGSLALAGLGLLSGCEGFPPQARHEARTPRIGELWTRVYDPLPPRYLAFLDGLRDLGWIEGRNVAFERRYAEDRPEHFPDLAAELVRQQVDILVAFGLAHARALRQVTSTIPIVMAGATTDPVRWGLVESLAHPGGNVTGTTNGVPGGVTYKKRLQLLKEAFPTIARVVFLFWSEEEIAQHALAALQEAASSEGVQIHPAGVRGPQAIERVFVSGMVQGMDALVPFTDPWLYNRRSQFMALAAQHRMPAIYDMIDGYREEGGLMVYAPNTPALYYRAATYVDRILRGAKPHDLPVEQPTRFDFVLNLKTAQALGLTFSPSILDQATEVIQ